MGLAIVRQIVEAHQGQAWAESEPGRGSGPNPRANSAREPSPSGSKLWIWAKMDARALHARAGAGREATRYYRIIFSNL
ncbi:MAG: hypothetical protein ACE5H9_15800 [Anaerolineae bacterium]